MMPQAALIQLGKVVAKSLASGHVSNNGDSSVGEALVAYPDAVPDVLDLMARESRKKKPNHALIGAFGFMVGTALETLRFRVERSYPEAVGAVEAARARVLSLAQEGRLDPGTLLLMLRQFVSAKLDLGDDLQLVMASLMDHETVRVLPGKADIDRTLAEMAEECGGDIFALHAELAEQVSTFPETHRVGIVAALLGAPDPSLREAAIGWLLDSGATTRRDTAGLLHQAATAGKITDTMLRRMIAVRNWLPDDDRPAVDAVIRACRQKGVECASLGACEVREVVATGVDGSGAQSMFVMVKDGRKQAAAALLLKRGVGVRDAWVDAGLTKAEADMFLYQVETQAKCYDSSMDYVRLSLGHALAVARGSGVLPPFALVDVVERAGLAAVNPEAVPVDSLVARLVADIPAERPTAAMVTKALKGSAAWEGDFPFIESWFEDDGAVDTLLDGNRLSAKRRMALVLTEYLPSRRAHWAELLAWTALTLRQDEATEDDWMGFALVARELLGDRPLAEIPLMTMIAKETVQAWRSRLF
jgi:hypothetical protein